MKSPINHRDLFTFPLQAEVKAETPEKIGLKLTLLKKAANFIFKKLKIQKKTSETTFSSKFIPTKNHISFASKKEESSHATKPEQDMFRMKAIMLLKKHELSIKMTETFSSKLQSSETSDTNVISFMQLLKPLPGEEIELTGQFKRTFGKHKRSIPLIETFRLEERTPHQTGFPHPMQHTGFAFCAELLPSCPLRLERLPLFHQLHRMRENAASGLLPKGRFNESAKKTLLFKGQAFFEQMEYFLELHQKLANAFLNIRTVNDAAIKPFFTAAKNAEDPLYFIASAYEVFNTHFIKEAKQHISLSKIEETYKEFIEKKQSFVLSLEDESKEKIAFVLFLASVFQESILTLFLQEMAQIAGFTPPTLRVGDKIVQTALYNQLEAFIEDLEKPLQSKDEAAKAMESKLLSDIALFTEGTGRSNLLDELEQYYKSFNPAQG